MNFDTELVQACNFYLWKYGVVNWFDIERRFPEKRRQELQKIFLKYDSKKRRDSKKYHIWRDSDTQVLVEAVSRHGRNWYYIQDHLFPWLTNVKLKNHYYVVGQAGRLPFFESLALDESYFSDRSNVLDDYKIECSKSVFELITYLMQ